MATSRCARCGATTLTEAEYVLDDQRLCALCYGLALSAGCKAPVLPTGPDDVVQIDPPAVDPEQEPEAGGPRAEDSGEPSMAGTPGPSGEPAGRPDAVAAGPSADLLPPGLSLARSCRLRINDDSVRPPAPAPPGWWHPVAGPQPRP
jgi:hypothetical protein